MTSTLQAEDAPALEGRTAALSEAENAERHLRLSLLVVVFDQTRLASLVSPVIAGVLCIALWGAGDRTRLLLWLGVLTLIFVARYLAAIAFRRSLPDADVDRWERIFAISLALASLAWGLGGLYILPAGSDFHQAVTFVFLMGMAGGSALNYAAHQRAAMISLLSFLAPVTLVFLLRQEAAFVCMGIGGLALVAVGASAIRRLGGFIRRSFELSLEIEQARQVAERRARTDALTGLFNRGAFHEMGNYLIAQAERQDHLLALLLIDTDYFKQVNDVHGHAAGDAVLRSLAAIMRESSRGVDVVGRLGGDEFAILLPEASVDDAVACANRLRQRLAQAPSPVAGLERHVTCSMGAAVHVKGESLDALFARADEALYESKRLGRDRVSTQAAPAQAELVAW
jgi:diguanylate cyclase (GGDEF)-like protein